MMLNIKMKGKQHQRFPHMCSPSLMEKRAQWKLLTS
jgi:hypothetical protein